MLPKLKLRSMPNKALLLDCFLLGCKTAAKRDVMCEGGSVHKNKIGIYFLIITAGIAVLTAFSHMSCIAIGESCYRTQLAPEPIIQSAINGTMLAPVGTIFISTLFILCAAYALSAAKLIVQLPLLNMGIYTISALCLFLGVATLPLSLMFPDMVNNFSIFAGVVWFFSGVLLLFGFRFINAVVK